MNLHRVYLHNLLWDQDSLGLLKRVENYLKIADSNDIKTLFVLLDDCWHPLPKLGKQPDPIPFVHNSQWIQQLLQNYYDKMYDYQLEKKKSRCIYKGSWDDVEEYITKL